VAHSSSCTTGLPHPQNHQEEYTIVAIKNDRPDGPITLLDKPMQFAPCLGMLTRFYNLEKCGFDGDHHYQVEDKRATPERCTITYKIIEVNE
jgi:hypothetical protein